MTATAQPVLKYLRRAIVLWVGTLFFVAGSAVVLTTIGEWRAARSFERAALVTRGAVVATTRENASRESNSSTRYVVTYRFTASDGTTVEQTEQLPFDDWEPLAEGSTLTVRYLPSDPGTARSRPPSPWWEMPLVVGFTGLFAVLGILLARPGVRRVLTILRVAKRGVDVTATVLDVAPTGDMINRVPQWRVRYEFRDRQGRAQTGASDLLAPQEAAEWRPAEKIVIRFDPERPQDSLWLGKRSV